MKLINKLLPVATLGSVAAVVVPLSTSCTSGTNLTSYDLGGVCDTSDWLQSETVNCNIKNAISEYEDAIKDDENIFARDLFYGTKLLFSQYVAELSGSTSSTLSVVARTKLTLTVNSSNATLSNVSFGDNSGNPSVSFDRTTKINGHLEALQVDSKTRVTTTSSSDFDVVVTAKVRNVPYWFITVNEKLGTCFILPIFGEFYQKQFLDTLVDDWSAEVSTSYSSTYNLGLLEQSQTWSGGGTYKITQNTYQNQLSTSEVIRILIPDCSDAPELAVEGPIALFLESALPVEFPSYYFANTEVGGLWK